MLFKEPEFSNWALFYDTYLLQYVCFAFALSVLLKLHCFWYTLAPRIVGAELFRGKKISEVGDIRSDDEDKNH